MAAISKRNKEEKVELSNCKKHNRNKMEKTNKQAKNHQPVKQTRKQRVLIKLFSVWHECFLFSGWASGLCEAGKLAWLHFLFRCVSIAFLWLTPEPCLSVQLLGFHQWSLIHRFTSVFLLLKEIFWSRRSDSIEQGNTNIYPSQRPRWTLNTAQFPNNGFHQIAAGSHSIGRLDFKQLASFKNKSMVFRKTTQETNASVFIKGKSGRFNPESDYLDLD